MSNKAASQFSTPMLYGAGLVALALVMLAGLRFAGGDEPAPIEEPATIAETQPELPRPALDPSVVEKATAALVAEPKVVDLVYDPALEVQWNIAVQDDGTRRDGLADYFCMVLGEHGAVVKGTAVRIVDAARRAELKDAYREYALATVDCTTHSPL